MNTYIMERGLFYYFMMQELNEPKKGLWSFILEQFGLSRDERYERVLLHPTLAQLSSVEDIWIYKNYLNSYIIKESDFGMDELESRIIDVKLSALFKINETFKEALMRENRVKILAHIYEANHTAAVLFALQAQYANRNSKALACEVLERELKEGKNSDAGILLLRNAKTRAKELFPLFAALPDMTLRPDLVSSLAKKYGCKAEVTPIRQKKNIGFGN